MLSLLSNCDDFATLRYLKFKERDIAVCDVHGRKKATQKKPQTHDLIGHKSVTRGALSRRFNGEKCAFCCFRCDIMENVFKAFTGSVVFLSFMVFLTVTCNLIRLATVIAFQKVS